MGLSCRRRWSGLSRSINELNRNDSGLSKPSSMLGRPYNGPLRLNNCSLRINAVLAIWMIPAKDTGERNHGGRAAPPGTEGHPQRRELGNVRTLARRTGGGKRD